MDRKGLTGILFTLFFGFAIAGYAQQVEISEAEKHYNLAHGYRKSELYEEAIKEFNRVAYLYPESDVADNALFELAEVYWIVGKKHADRLEIMLEITSITQAKDIVRVTQSDDYIQCVLNWSKAEERLLELLKNYPNSELAEEAEDRLEEYERTLERIKTIRDKAISVLERYEAYLKEKIDSDKIILATLISPVPIIGHYMAKDWRRGIKFVPLEAGCLSIIGVGLTRTETTQRKQFIAAGAWGFLFAKMLEAQSVTNTADDYNNRLWEKHGLKGIKEILP